MVRPGPRLAFRLVQRSAFWVLLGFMLFGSGAIADPPPGYYDAAEGQTGYQRQASGQVDPSAVKPPQGDTAIVRPEKPAQKQ